MKTIKIGRSSINNIVLSDATVSAQHAIITIYDSKEVKIKDLNSTNGTYVNGKRISAETNITASDVIKAGNSIVDWVKHLGEQKKPSSSPASYIGDVSGIKQKKTIGRTAGNDIVIGHGDVSSSHAQLIENLNGEIVIADSGSTNGTYVNGQKVSVHTLRSGDRVMIANKYPLNWESIYPPKKVLPQPQARPKSNKTVLMVAASVAAVVVMTFGAWFFFLKPPPECPWTPDKVYSYYKKSVVMIYTQYYYSVTAGDNYLGNYVISNNRLIEDGVNSITGTGFFVSADGKIVTNKHVAQPWFYAQNEVDALKEYWQDYIKRLASRAKTMQELVHYQSLINEVKVEGNLHYVGIALNDTHVSTINDFIPCMFLNSNSNNEIDIAVIQTNSKTLPPGVENVVDLGLATVEDAGIIIGHSVYTIGFPAGLAIGDTPEGIQANNQDGKITQERGEFEFGHNIAIVGGASGSPVFNECGKLIGVVHRGRAVHGYNMAVKAKYAVELVK